MMLCGGRHNVMHKMRVTRPDSISTICALINEHVRKHVNLPFVRVYFSYSGVYFSTYLVRGCTVIKGCFSMYLPICQGVRLFGTVRLLGRR